MASSPARAVRRVRQRIPAEAPASKIDVNAVGLAKMTDDFVLPKVCRSMEAGISQPGVHMMQRRRSSPQKVLQGLQVTMRRCLDGCISKERPGTKVLKFAASPPSSEDGRARRRFGGGPLSMPTR
eukprot:scaffold576_cov260-Pinguiococcus_pyrenoidosus.AAC.111